MHEVLIPPTLARLMRVSTTAAFERHERRISDGEPHRHALGQLVGSSQGLITVSCDEGSWVVPATHGIWIPPHRPHAIRSHAPLSFWSVYVAERACTGLPSVPRTLRTAGLLREAVHRMVSWGTQDHEPWRERLGCVIRDEIACLPEEPLGLTMPREPRLLRIARRLLEDLAEDRGLEAWARWAAIPARTLSRRFVIETGFTFTAWRQRARLLRSLELLAQGEAVTTISLELGYDNVSAFIALFRRTFGVTPKAYTRRPPGA